MGSEAITCTWHGLKIQYTFVHSIIIMTSIYLCNKIGGPNYIIYTSFLFLKKWNAHNSKSSAQKQLKLST